MDNYRKSWPAYRLWFQSVIYSWFITPDLNSISTWPNSNTTPISHLIHYLQKILDHCNFRQNVSKNKSLKFLSVQNFKCPNYLQDSNNTLKKLQSS